MQAATLLPSLREQASAAELRALLNQVDRLRVQLEQSVGRDAAPPLPAANATGASLSSGTPILPSTSASHSQDKGKRKATTEEETGWELVHDRGGSTAGSPPQGEARGLKAKVARAMRGAHRRMKKPKVE